MTTTKPPAPAGCAEMAIEQGASVKPSLRRRVLNAGCGANAPRKLHSLFRTESWQEVRLDIDPAVKPDLVSSIVDMKKVVPDHSFDAVWTSHNIEHLYSHEVPVALSEFRRILGPGGFALLTCPDLEAIAQLVLSRRLEEVAYNSPAGPVATLDMIYGHRGAIERGNHFMAHRTGFTRERLGRLLIERGFAEARAIKGNHFDIWAIAVLPDSDTAGILGALKATGLDFLDCSFSKSEIADV